tara:strand:- start:108 stop:572 length:465 start_codon:yes stop_codon:yes gene_type:complete
METSPRNRLETGSAFVFSAASEYRTGSTSFNSKSQFFFPRLSLGITNLDFRFDTNKKEKTSFLCDEKDRQTKLLFLRPLIRDDRRQSSSSAREKREIQLEEMKILCINISARRIQKKFLFGQLNFYLESFFGFSFWSLTTFRALTSASSKGKSG